MNTYAVVGLGYVGLGLAIALGKHHAVYGYDLNKARIRDLKKKIDKNQLVSSEELGESSVVFTHQLDEIKSANFYIVAVSTPAYCYDIPDLDPLMNAVEQLALIIKKGDIIVFESTVYPSTTEKHCIPLLEKLTQLKCGVDFQVGYSPERINPNDHEHNLKNITKIVSAQNKETLAIIQATYATICDHVYPVSSIAAAESIKLLENVQRDVNVAFMNEFSKIMHALDIDMYEVLEGAKTKWSFVPFKPGFVGGHCISIDPTYLAFIAKRNAVQPDLILTARKINDDMTRFVIESMLKLCVQNKMNTCNLRVVVLGLTYKENTADFRNSLSLKLIKELGKLNIDFCSHDPFAPDSNDFREKYHTIDFSNLSDRSIVILTVPHTVYQTTGLKQIIQMSHAQMVMDIPNLFVQEAKTINDLIYWNL